MKHFLVKSVVARALASGGSGNFSRHIVAGSAMPEMKLQNIYGYLPRMSSTLAPSPVEKEKYQEEKQENGKGDISSYWGISKPKIKREDGTEWPWNCFMVQYLYLNYFDLLFICIHISNS